MIMKNSMSVPFCFDLSYSLVFLFFPFFFFFSSQAQPIKPWIVTPSCFKLISLASETQRHLKGLQRTMNFISTMNFFLLISYGLPQGSKKKYSRDILRHLQILTSYWQNWDQVNGSTRNCMPSRALGRIMLNSAQWVRLIFVSYTLRMITWRSHHLWLATASYRLLPHIKIKKPIPLHLAQKFQKCFSPGVIRVDPRTQEVSVDEQNVRKDSVSREVFRHPEFADSVDLSRVRDYFLCVSSSKSVSSLGVNPQVSVVCVESEGPYAPERLLPEAIKVMRVKLTSITEAAVALREKYANVDNDHPMVDAWFDCVYVRVYVFFFFFYQYIHTMLFERLWLL